MCRWSIRPASEPLPASIHYVDHDGEGLAQMQQFFGVKPEDLVYSAGQGWAIEEITAITHTGTHVDAPYHYGADVRGQAGAHHRPGAAGVVLRPRRRARRAAQGGRRVHHRRRPAETPSRGSTTGCGRCDIVLLHTGADKRLGSPDYFAQPGLGREGVLWLVEQGVRVIGIDAYTLDRPFADMVADYRRTGDGRYIWPAHFAGIDAGILPDREAGQPGPDPAAARLLRVVPAGEDQGGQRRLVPGRGARG